MNEKVKISKKKSGKVLEVKVVIDKTKSGDNPIKISPSDILNSLVEEYKVKTFLKRCTLVSSCDKSVEGLFEFELEEDARKTKSKRKTKTSLEPDSSEQKDTEES